MERIAHRAKLFHQLTGKLALVHEGEVIPIGVREPILNRSRAREREGGAPELLQRSAHHYLGTGRYCCVVKPLAEEYSADPHKNKISTALLSFLAHHVSAHTGL